MISKFLGGSLDGQEVDVPVGIHSWRVPKLGLAVNRFEELPSLAPEFDVETYLYDHILGRFVEESMASDECIKWETYELKMTLHNSLGEEDSELFIFGKRHFTREFDARIASETLKMGRKIGLRLNAIKFLLDKIVELKKAYDDSKRENATLLADLKAKVEGMERYGLGLFVDNALNEDWIIEPNPRGAYLSRADVLQIIEEAGK